MKKNVLLNVNKVDHCTEYGKPCLRFFKDLDTSRVHEIGRWDKGKWMTTPSKITGPRIRPQTLTEGRKEDRDKA